MEILIKGSFELMKQLNISVVLKAVMGNGALSRADIAKITGLTPATITNITKELMERGYLVQSRIGESSGGRPPIILELDPNARYIIGVSIGVGKIEVVISNIIAEILIKKSVDLENQDRNKDNVLSIIVNLVNEIIDESGIHKEKIIGVGIAMHGIVNSYTGISEYSPYYGWRNIDIKKELSEKIEYPIFLDNDVRTMALGESWFGIAKSKENFIVINVSNGIGAGIIIDNKPYYGVNFSAGEIGHISVRNDGRRCNCGNYGCLETISSNNSIVEKVVELLKNDFQSILLKKGSIERITIKDICDAAKEKDSLAVNAIAEAAMYIGMVISNLINILNPEYIIMVGEIFKDNSHAIEIIEEEVSKRALKLSAETVRITKSSLGEDAATIGAVTLVIKELFEGEKIVFN